MSESTPLSTRQLFVSRRIVNQRVLRWYRWSASMFLWRYEWQTSVFARPCLTERPVSDAVTGLTELPVSDAGSGLTERPVSGAVSGLMERPVLGAVSAVTEQSVSVSVSHGAACFGCRVGSHGAACSGYRGGSHGAVCFGCRVGCHGAVCFGLRVSRSGLFRVPCRVSRSGLFRVPWWVSRSGLFRVPWRVLWHVGAGCGGSPPPLLVCRGVNRRPTPAGRGATSAQSRVRPPRGFTTSLELLALCRYGRRETSVLSEL